MFPFFKTSLHAEQELSRRTFLREFTALTGLTVVAGAELLRSAPLAISGDPANPDRAWGGIKGRLIFDGDAPERKEVDLSKTNLAQSDLQWFKSMGPILNEDWVVDKKSKAVQWVFVWLLPEDPKTPLALHESRKAIAEKDRTVVVDQQPLGYTQHGVILREGQTLLMKNTGPVAHVLTMPTSGVRNPSLNESMPPRTEKLIAGLKPERNNLIVSCTPHPWERMFLRIVDHPYFAVTKADGTFEIGLIPAGKCRIVVWQETLGFKGGAAGREGSIVTVEGGAVTDLGDITIKPTN